MHMVANASGNLTDRQTGKKARLVVSLLLVVERVLERVRANISRGRVSSSIRIRPLVKEEASFQNM
jgi:hypothetical protein